ncbi:MAG: hypothetical protein ACE5OP_02995 [Candidatus Glassbacteria bacterium]
MQRKVYFSIKALSVALAAIGIAVIPSYAQAPDVLWTRSFDGGDYECGWSVQQTADGGYIIVGVTWPPGGSIEVTTPRQLSRLPFHRVSILSKP